MPLPVPDEAPTATPGAEPPPAQAKPVAAKPVTAPPPKAEGHPAYVILYVAVLDAEGKPTGWVEHRTIRAVIAGTTATPEGGGGPLEHGPGKPGCWGRHGE